MRRNGVLGRLRRWLAGPISVRAIALPGYVASLAVLAWIPLPSESLPMIFWAAIVLGIVAICSLVYSPDLNQGGSRLAAFFLTFVMHGLVTWASLRSGYYPRFLAGGYFGEAVRISAFFVLLEWGATIVLGRAFTTTARPTVLRWHLASALILIVLVAVAAAPLTLARGYSVSAGAAPVRYRRISVDVTKGDGALPSALVKDVFVQTQWDWRTKLSRLIGLDIKQDREWAVDVAPPQLEGFPPPSLALENGTGLVLVVTELLHVNAAGDRSCWVVWVDVQTGMKVRAETVIRAPWLNPDASAIPLEAGWQRPPLIGDRPVRVDHMPDGSLIMEGKGFKWSLRGAADFKEFIIGSDVVVMRDLRNEKYWYHIFLLPVPES